MAGQKSNTQDQFKLKSPKPRYINIYENIFLVLSVEALKVYMTLRYESDYARDCSSVARNIQFIINKTGISRRKIIYCFKELEQHGLLFIERKKGFQSVYWVASDLNYFNKLQPDEPVHEVHDPVHEVHDPVHEVHDINNNLCINNTINSESNDSPATDFVNQVIDVYHEQLPEMPKIKLVTNEIKKAVKVLEKEWVNIKGDKITIQAISRYFEGRRKLTPWILQPYQTKDGNTRRSRLINIIRIDNVRKFYNGDYQNG